MDKINGVSQIVKLLQSRIGKNKEKSRTENTGSDNKNSIENTTKNPVEELERKISKKIALLDKKSSNYKSAAINIFVEEILHWEFNSEITTDPEFDKLQEKITTAFKENEALNKGFEKILSEIG